MNTIPDELLMAYADGELNDAEHSAERAQVEAAIKAYPDIAARIEKHRALRRRLNATFDRVLDEPVPSKLIHAVRATPHAARASAGSQSADGNLADAPSAARASADQRRDVSFAAQPSPNATVSDLSAARAEKAASAAAANRPSRWSLPQWAAIAASVVIGVLIGHFALTSGNVDPIASSNGKLVAQAGLADALSSQLASTQEATASIQIGTSFKNKSGNYCRTFVIQNGNATGGLACRDGNDWTIDTLARAENTQGDYRQAGSEMPQAIRAEVENQIVGDPLDSSGEANAKANHWK